MGGLGTMVVNILEEQEGSKNIVLKRHWEVEPRRLVPEGVFTSRWQ